MLKPVVLLVALLAQWPQFRGPDGTGVSKSTGLPIAWSETQNVKWKTAIHGRAWSSPVVLGNQVWVTTATPDGKQLSALALAKDSGKILFDLKLFDVETPQFAHKFNTYASPTPVIEPGRSTSRSDPRAPPRSTPRPGRCCGSGAISSATISAVPDRRRFCSGTC